MTSRPSTYGAIGNGGGRGPVRSNANGQIETRKLLADSVRTAREAEEIGK